MISIERYLVERVARDLSKKMVFLTGPRQAGKTTLSRQIIERLADNSGDKQAQYLNYDVQADRSIIDRYAWNPRAQLLVLDEVHKMPLWKNWLKGVYDGKPANQQILITGSARLDTFRRAGDSLAGRYFALRLHPISVAEWCKQTGASSEDALAHLLERGGFPEPCLASSDDDAKRWRRDYFDGLIRDDVLEFSRLHELRVMRLFVEILRSRVGSPLSLASIARDLQVSPTTLKRYLEILEALYIVFIVRPWHKNIARATLQAPKVYFYDTGLVVGDEGLVFENLVATALLKQTEFVSDTKGIATQLCYVRTKDGAEVDFAVSADNALEQLIECKLSDVAVHRPLSRFASELGVKDAIQLVRNARHDDESQAVAIRRAAPWLANLSA